MVRVQVFRNEFGCDKERSESRNNDIMTVREETTPMQEDAIETFGASTIQHGKLSNRIYVMHLQESDFPAILPELNHLANRNGYTKIFARIPHFAYRGFLDDGYRCEAKIPVFFAGTQPGYFMAKYFDEARAHSLKEEEEQAILDKAGQRIRSETPSLRKGYTLAKCEPADAEDMAHLYRAVYDSYPFPIFSPDYLSDTMQRNFVYYAVRKGAEIVSVASAEIDFEALHAEVSDFATLPEYRRKGFAACLVSQLENELHRMKIATVFTIARAQSPGINMVFGGSKYAFAGMLINNTNIFGSIQDMNVWYKLLPHD
ncbi:MAG: putative beta-lysine N-acetyltransferase [Chitinivibrionales bacterium]|nr:putative beta-lysine N-acetyltransferase [Chitinivibrionales bacterium]